MIKYETNYYIITTEKIFSLDFIRKIKSKQKTEW